MSYALWAILRAYAPRMTLPIAAVVGFVGYHVESRLTDYKNPPYLESVQKKREERLIDELSVGYTDEFTHTLKDKKFVPKTVFEKNVSPTLLDE